jgi:hypothetical protein
MQEKNGLATGFLPGNRSVDHADLAHDIFDGIAQLVLTETARHQTERENT